MPEFEKTENGSFEVLSWHKFDGVEYDRIISWRDGGHSIILPAEQKSTQAAGSVLIPAGTWVLVIDTMVKLVSKQEHHMTEQMGRGHQHSQGQALEETEEARGDNEEKEIARMKQEEETTRMKQEEEDMAALDAGGWVVIEADAKTT